MFVQRKPESRVLTLEELLICPTFSFQLSLVAIMILMMIYPGVKLRGNPTDLRSGTSCLRPATSNNRSCTSQLRSGTFLLGSTTLHSLYVSIFLHAWCFVKKKSSPSRSSCHLHLSTLGVDRWCKRQALLECHISQTECPSRRSGTPPLLSRPFGLELRPFMGLAPIGIHHLLLSNLTTGYICRIWSLFHEVDFVLCSSNSASADRELVVIALFLLLVVLVVNICSV